MRIVKYSTATSVCRILVREIHIVQIFIKSFTILPSSRDFVSVDKPEILPVFNMTNCKNIIGTWNLKKKIKEVQVLTLHWPRVSII